MSKIKTREKGKDIKVLDKSAVVGQRMKNAFIRSKRNAAALMDDRQATPSEYAGDKVEFAADDLAHDTANVAVSGTKTAVRQGRKLFQRQREKRAAEKRRKNTNRPSPPNRPRVRPRRASPCNGTAGQPWRDGSRASEPGRPRSASTSHGMSAQWSGPWPMLTLSALLTPQALLLNGGGPLPRSRPQSGPSGNGR